MRPLHVEILVTDPQREDVAALRSALGQAGHLVVDHATAKFPQGVSPAPDFVVVEGSAAPAPESLDAAEARHIRAVLQFTGGNRRQAASLLGIARSTLLAKVRKHGI